MEFRVSPHRHSQSLSRDVPSLIRLPSAIIRGCVPENDDDKDDEKSTKKEIEEENIFVVVYVVVFFLPFWCSEVLLF
jgi:hypothetical protein